jgi:site-specific DNA-cytosine methylase
LKIVSLFSGIGGLDWACEQAFGGRTVLQCDIEPACQEVLAAHWPDNRLLYSDIQDLINVPHCDVICGGFPCVGLSIAGKRKGISGDEHSGLWREMLRLIQGALPKYVVVENSSRLLREPEQRRLVQEPLEALGYGVCWTLMAAEDVGAPHLRERTYMLATMGGTSAPVVIGVRSKGTMRWPTPVYNDLNSRGVGYQQGGQPLTAEVRKWATPTHRDHRSGAGRKDNGHSPQLCEQVGGVINPEWEELLMGYPMGWTRPNQQVAILADPLWPSRPGEDQPAWEPPRLLPPRTQLVGLTRRQRVGMLGNAVVPQQALAAILRLKEMAQLSAGGYLEVSC